MARVNPITLERPTADEEPLQPRLNEALVRELASTAKGGAAGMLGAIFMYAMLVAPWTSHVETGLFAGLVAITVVRLAGAIWLMRGAIQRFPAMRVFRWCAVVYGISGGCLAAILLVAAPSLTVVKVLMLLVIMIGINSTAVVTLSASPLLYALYLTAPVVAWNVIAFCVPLPGLEHVLQFALPIYTLAQMLTVRSVHRSLRNNVVLRLRLASSLGELRDAQSQLVEASRLAGRSDVAKAVLHNVGNVLNSANVSATLARDIIGQIQTAGLAKTAALMTEHRDDLGGFLRDDPRGAKLPDYLLQVQRLLERDKTAAAGELRTLMRNIDHIKVIVASQQSHVQPGGVVETFEVRELLDDALAFCAAGGTAGRAEGRIEGGTEGGTGGGIEIIRDFDAVPSATFDRHKALQILLNLLANARDAVLAARPAQPRIAVRARLRDPAELEIAIEDNGCGIAAHDLERIFQLGFTTKSTGHGLGLHYSACAAQELAGSLTARSAGPGRGAEFVLVLPLDATAPRGERASA